MSAIRVALLQMIPCGDDQQANLEKGEEFCRRASERGADIALFPEMWNVGYSSYDPDQPGAREHWVQQAIRPDDDWLLHFRRLARDLSMAIVITYLEAWEGLPRNSASLIDRHGELVMTYAKVHTGELHANEAICKPGDDFYVCDLDLREGTIKVGTMICYDREFPESARILMLKGAELILTPNACTLDDLRIGQFRIRAYENAVAVAMTNYAEPRNNGHSAAFSAAGSKIVEAGEEEGITLADFNLDEMRAYRAKTVLGNAFRRPHRYTELVSMDVNSPFQRENAFGEPFRRTER